MRFDDFMKLREEGRIPDDLPPLLEALLLDSIGDWDSAHKIAQNVFTKEGSWVHGYLHRKEGDIPNAAYWYGNAGRKLPEIELVDEWEIIARELCGDK